MLAWAARRADIAVGDAVATDHGHGLGVGRRISGERDARLDHLGVPVVGGGLGLSHMAAHGRVARLAKLVERRAEVRAVGLQPLQVVAVARDQEAPEAVLLARQLQLDGGERTHVAVGGAARLAGGVEGPQVEEDHRAHGGDGQQHGGERERQLAADGQIGEQHDCFPSRRGGGSAAEPASG